MVTPQNGFDSPRGLGVLRAAGREHLLFRRGGGDTLWRSGNDPTHCLHQRIIFCLAAGIPNVLPGDSAGYDGVPFRTEKAARLASLVVAGGSLRRPGGFSMAAALGPAARWHGALRCLESIAPQTGDPENKFTSLRDRKMRKKLIWSTYCGFSSEGNVYRDLRSAVQSR
jgi:hypothetical protein